MSATGALPNVIVIGAMKCDHGDAPPVQRVVSQYRHHQRDDTDRLRVFMGDDLHEWS